MPIYEVEITVPAHHETVTTSGENEQEAVARAIASAMSRVVDKSTVTVKELPSPVA